MSSARVTERITERITEKDWEVLLRRIKDGRCTFFLGAGVYSEGPSMRTAVAQKWATEYKYPLTDGTDLARVARFLTVEYGDAEYPRAKYVEELNKAPQPTFTDPNDPYVVLANLPLPIYITTNYDDFMERALMKAHRDVKRDLCKWVKSLDEVSPLVEQGFQPDVANPAVFHLYGYATNQQSMALSEDDYFQFLINVSKYPELIPARIQRAISGNSMILLGYSLEDWDFRVLFHFLAGYLENCPAKTHVAVQLSPAGNNEEVRQRAQAFFDKYFESRSPDIRVTWDSTQDFISDLKSKWEQSGYAT